MINNKSLHNWLSNWSDMFQKPSMTFQGNQVKSKNVGISEGWWATLLTNAYSILNPNLRTMGHPTPESHYVTRLRHLS